MTTSTSRTQTRVLLIDDDGLIAGSLFRYLLTPALQLAATLRDAAAVLSKPPQSPASAI